MFEDSFTGPPRKAQAFGDNVYHFWSREWMGMCSFHPVPYSPPMRMDVGDGITHRTSWDHEYRGVSFWCHDGPWVSCWLCHNPQPRCQPRQACCCNASVEISATQAGLPSLWQLWHWRIYHLVRWFSQRTKPPWLGHRDFPWQSPFDYHIYHRVTG